jgi:uncharacterized protein YndB with AHSA1/START domain
MRDDTNSPPAGESHRTIRMERRLQASPDRVSRAWTDAEELARWLPLRVEGALAEGARTVLVLGDRRTWWEVVEERSGELFVFRCPWLDGDRVITTVRISIRPSGYGTTLRLEDGPFPIDQPDGLDAWAAALSRWSEAMVMLRAYVDFSVDVRERR